MKKSLKTMHHPFSQSLYNNKELKKRESYSSDPGLGGMQVTRASPMGAQRGSLIPPASLPPSPVVTFVECIFARQQRGKALEVLKAFFSQPTGAHMVTSHNPTMLT